MARVRTSGRLGDNWLAVLSRARWLRWNYFRLGLFNGRCTPLPPISEHLSTLVRSSCAFILPLPYPLRQLFIQLTPRYSCFFPHYLHVLDFLNRMIRVDVFFTIYSALGAVWMSFKIYYRIDCVGHMFMTVSRNIENSCQILRSSLLLRTGWKKLDQGYEIYWGIQYIVRMMMMIDTLNNAWLR